MGLKEAHMEHVETSTGDVVIETDADESAVITGIEVETNSTVKRVELKVGRSTLGYRYIDTVKTNHLFIDKTQVNHEGFEQILRDMGIETRLPISSGENFTLAKSGAEVVSRIKYEIHDAGDITKDMVNGTEADEYYVVNYGVISEGGFERDKYNLLDMSLQPPEIPSFPFGGSVPAKTEIDIFALFGIPSVKPNGANHEVYTTRMKLVAGRETLLTKQEDGFLFTCAGNQVTDYEYNYVNSSIGFGVHKGLDMPFVFPTPLTFRTGEELGIYVYYKDEAGAAGNIFKYENERMGVVERVRKVA